MFTLLASTCARNSGFFDGVKISLLNLSNAAKILEALDSVYLIFIFLERRGQVAESDFGYLRSFYKPAKLPAAFRVQGLDVSIKPGCADKAGGP